MISAWSPGRKRCASCRASARPNNGESSGAVVQAMGVRSLRIGAPIDPGVPCTQALRRGEEINTFRVDIPHDADELERDR